VQQGTTEGTEYGAAFSIEIKLPLFSVTYCMVTEIQGTTIASL